MKLPLLNYVGGLKQSSIESISGAMIANVPEEKMWDIKVTVSFTT